MKRRDALASIGALLVGVRGTRADVPAQSYVDPTAADMPWPYFSFARQPWRSYLEVVPAARLVGGVGVVWGGPIPGVTEDDAAREIAAAGFSRVRIELPWSAMRWDEGGLVPAVAQRTLWILQALAKHGLRPTVLLNAHHGAPCPMLVSRWRVAVAAPAGSTTITLDRSANVTPGDSMVVTLSDSAHAGPLVTAVRGKALTLSKPIPRALLAGDQIDIGRLKYLPLYPVGTPEFERTAGGWLRYARYMAGLAAAQVGPELDVEIWNELSFGSEFLDINFYYKPPLVPKGPDFLHAGGAAWELARRTVGAVREVAPRAKLIWGFSNTTAFHTSVPELPAGIDGQSFHPYGVGPRCYDRMVAGRESYNVGGFVPPGCAKMPEGWAHTFQQTESYMRLLNPAARAAHPPGVTEFSHYFTEHGFAPREVGIVDASAAQRTKEKLLLRAPIFWLNKGLSGLYIYNTYYPDESQFGVLDRNGGPTPATRALRRLLDRFAGAVPAPAGALKTLAARVDRVAGPRAFYANDPDGRYVSQSDRVVVLPYRVNADKLVVGVYLMTEDFPADLAPEAYRISLDGLAAQPTSVEYYDPLSDSLEPVQLLGAADGSLTVQLALTDCPRLLEITPA